MATRQTLVQLSDSLVALLDERAHQLGVSRSRLIRDAVQAYLRDTEQAAVDAAIVAGYRRIPSEDDPWARMAAEASVRREPW